MSRNGASVAGIGPCRPKGYQGLTERCYRLPEVKTLPHLHPHSLEKYLFHRSSHAHLVRTEEHLLVCDLCRDRLDEFDAFVQTMKDIFGESAMTAGARAYAGGASGSASEAVK